MGVGTNLLLMLVAGERERGVCVGVGTNLLLMLVAGERERGVCVCVLTCS